jgi:hypothetical protein
MATAAPALISRYRVSLAGRILSVGPIAAGDYKLALTPLSFAAVTEHGSPQSEARQYIAFIRPDGQYYFQDVPAGSYVLNAQDQKGRRVEQRVVLPPGEPGHRPPVTEADVRFEDHAPSPADQSHREAPPARHEPAAAGRSAARSGRGSRTRA